MIESVKQLTPQDYHYLIQYIKNEIPIRDLGEAIGLSFVKNCVADESGKASSSYIFVETNSFYRYSQSIGGSGIDLVKHYVFNDNPSIKITDVVQKIVDVMHIDLDELFKGNKKNYQTFEKKAIKKDVLELSNEELVEFFLSDSINVHQKNNRVFVDYRDKNSYNILFNYLVNKRCISKSVVDLMCKNYIIPAQNPKNEKQKGVLSIAYNFDGTRCGLTYCSVEKHFKQCFNSTISTKGNLIDFEIPPSKLLDEILYQNDYTLEKIRKVYQKPKPLLCFESIIEMMSYMTLLEMNGNNLNDYRYLSCESISNYKAIITNAKVLNTKEVVIMFNNDYEKEKNWGQIKAELVSEILEESNIEAGILIPPKPHNDINDYLKSLCNEKEKNKTHDISK